MRRFLVPAALVALLVGCGGDDDGGDEATGTVASVTTDEPGTEPPDTSEAPDTARSAPLTSPSGPPPTLSVSPATVTPENPPAAGGSGASLPLDHPLVTGAVADLAGRLGVDPSAITVVDARSVTWGDRSLGCPQPGMAYPQVLVDGTLVVLETGGRRYEYHGGNPLFLCENPTPPSGGG